MFGRRLKDLRLKAQLTQDDLSRKLGVSPSTVGMYEQGRRDPDTATLLTLADLFDCSTDYLLGRVNKPYLALLEDIPQELHKEGVEAIEMTKNAVKNGLTSDQWRDLLDLVQRLNKSNKT